MDKAATDPLVEVAFGTLYLVGIILLHGIALRSITRRFNAAWVRVNARTARWRVSVILMVTIGCLAAVHLFETLVWALPLVGLGLFTLRDSYFFVLGNYTTLGANNVALPDAWRLVGPMIAMSGIFTFGWTGSVLVTIMNELGKLDRTQATEGQHDTSPPARGGT